MSFVWTQNDHVKAYFFHHVKLWASGPLTLGTGGFRDHWGATGAFWGLEGDPQKPSPWKSIGKPMENKPKTIVKSMTFQNHVKTHGFSL